MSFPHQVFNPLAKQDMSCVMRQPTSCICKNKDVHQLRGNREADQRLCFRNIDSTISLLSKSEISSLKPASVVVQPGLCRTRSETRTLVFSRRGSYYFALLQAGIPSKQLRMCLEPEAAATYCQTISCQSIDLFSSQLGPLLPGSRYILIDAGGTFSLVFHGNR